MISIEHAYELLELHLEVLPTSPTPLSSMVDRILVKDVRSDVASPPHDKSVMDGFAIRTGDLAAGHVRFRVVETIIAGGWPEHALKPGETARIMTGAPLPPESDAVVMVELTETENVDGIEWVTFEVDSVAPEKHILRSGVNFSKGQIVLPQGHTVRANDIGLLAEVGAHSISTPRRPTMAVIPTGNELVDCRELPGRGQIRNSNGPMLIAMARKLGLEVADLGIGQDEKEPLRKAIGSGLEHDLLLLSGGVSAGTMDLVPEILKEMGVEEVFHRVAVKPGKPIWFGVLKRESRSTFVFGLPGNPVSSLVGFQLFVRSAVRRMMGGELRDVSRVTGELTEFHETRGNRPTYWPGHLVVDDSPVRKIKPLLWRGSSDLFALGESDGLIHFPADSSQHQPGKHVQFLPFG